MRALFALVTWVVTFVFIYAMALISYFFNHWNLESQIAAGIVLKLEDMLVYGFGTFQWWAILLTAVASTIVTTFVILTVE